VPDNDGFDEGFVPLDKVVPLKGRRRIKLIPFIDLKVGHVSNYLVKGLIPRIGLVVAWGPPKCGKSFWTFDLVMHIALGWEYRGHRVQSGPVVYCAFEGADGFRGRAEAFRRQHGIQEAPFYLVPAVMDLIADHGQLIAAIRAQTTTPVVVTLDTLNRSLVGSESNDEDMGKYVRAADAIREAFNCVVVIVHHCGVDGTRPRGHTSLTGACDAQLAVKRDGENAVVVTVEHMKDGVEGEVIRSRLEMVELGLDDDGDPITSCVIVPADGSHLRGDKVKISPAARLALTMLAEAINDVGSIPSTSPRIPQNTRTIRTTDWRSYCYAGTISDSDNPDSKSRAFRRAANELQAAHIIGIWQEHVWIAGQAGQSRT
jgi:hypothetical protein